MAWRDTNFGALPPSYDDVLAAGSSRLVRGGSSSGLSRQITPFTLVTPTPQANATPFTIVPEEGDIDDFNDPILLESTSPVVHQPSSQNPRGIHSNRTQRPSTTAPTQTSGGNHTNRTPRPSVTGAASTSGGNRAHRPSTSGGNHSNRTPRPSVASTRPSTNAQRPRQSQQQSLSVIDQLAIFSMPSIMLNGLTLPKIELDPEANIPNREAILRVAKTTERIRFGCGCFWFFGFVILLLLISAPVAMVLAGLFGRSDCTFSNNIISNILFILGALLAGLLVLRMLTSAMACCKLSNVFGWRRSKSFSVVVLIIEVIFATVAITYVILLFLSTWYLFSVSPNTTSVDTQSPDYCSDGFYTAAVAMVGSSLGLFIIIVIYLSTISIFYVMCQNMLAETPTRSKPRTPRHTNR